MHWNSTAPSRRSFPILYLLAVIIVLALAAMGYLALREADTSGTNSFATDPQSSSPPAP